MCNRAYAYGSLRPNRPQQAICMYSQAYTSLFGFAKSCWGPAQYDICAANGAVYRLKIGLVSTKIDVWLNGQANDPVFKWYLNDLKINLPNKSYKYWIAHLKTSNGTSMSAYLFQNLQARLLVGVFLSKQGQFRQLYLEVFQINVGDEEMNIVNQVSFIIGAQEQLLKQWLNRSMQVHVTQVARQISSIYGLIVMLVADITHLR